MRFYLHTSASNMARAELVTAALFGAGHEPTQPWRECYQVDLAAIGLADVVIALATADAPPPEEVVRVATALERPVLLWREPGAETLPVARAGHRLVYDMLRGDLADARQMELLIIQAAELVRQHEAGAFGRGNYGHGDRVLEALKRGGAA